MNKSTLLSLLFLLGCMPVVLAQIVTTDPPFPRADQSVTIIFDAAQGTAGLANCGCDVYVHTGVITSAGGGWRYVETEWGVSNPAWKMTPVAGQPNKYQYVIGPTIREFYGVPAEEEILQMAFVFRNGDGTREGKASGGQDIFVNVFGSDPGLRATINTPSNTNFTVALGQTIMISGQASQSATLSLYDNGELIAQEENATSLSYNLLTVDTGDHQVQLIATTAQESDTAGFNYRAEFQARLLSPNQPVILVNVGQTIPVIGTSYVTANLSLLDGSTVLASTTGDRLNYNLRINEAGARRIRFVAEYDGQIVETSFLYVTPDERPAQDPPFDFPAGITVENDSTLYLELYAPGKQVVFVIGSFNNWTPTLEHRMNRATDGATYWLELDSIDLSGDNYLTFQYLVDGAIRVADPLSTLVLDPAHDPFIPEETFPELPPYPTGQASGIVSLVYPELFEYEWVVNDFAPAPKEELVIYEMLLRDFLADHDYPTLIDTLDYLQRLGVNAIELMPVNEFEGNISWGYNPSFHMALDKFYGTPYDFKRFIDDCHNRGIAVILDVVYNHAFDQSPLAQMWWDGGQQRPAANSPYFNPIARHPFNVGNDFNHESAATRNYVDEVIAYWLREFRVDGYRFDLSKGFTQTFNTDVGAWGVYDASRIAILKHYADEVWEANDDAIVILEHFGDNPEELELTTYGNGMLVWGGGTSHEFQEASLGYPSNLNVAVYTNRGWTHPGVIAYMESHDEERMMYKNLNFGNSAGSYDVKDYSTALRRVELAATFFYSIPGPKMLWQFGELAYDYSINYCDDGNVNAGCRLVEKPIRWDYVQQPGRQRLYNITSALIDLKTNYDVFNTTDFNLSLNQPAKTIHLLHPDMDVAVQGNFDVAQRPISNPFPHGGWWYEYFTGDSVQVTDPAAAITFRPGEYHLYTSVRLEAPPGGYVASREIVTNAFGLRLAPNPAGSQVLINYQLDRGAPVQVQLVNLFGQTVQTLFSGPQTEGEQQLWTELTVPAGIYLVQVRAGGAVQTERLVVSK